MEKNIIMIIVILFIITNCINFGLFFNNRKNIEKMSNTDIFVSEIKRQINLVYKTDVQAIRNLSDISLKLQKGGLTIPGDITVEGNINLKKDLKMVNNASIRSTGRLHLAPEESLYLLPKKGTMVTKGWGASGTIDVHGKIKGIGELDIEGNINLKKDLKMVNAASIRSTGRLHIAPEEILYVLPKKGTMLTKDWGSSGTIDADTINADTIIPKKIRPISICDWWNDGSVATATHAANYKYGDLIPVRWNHAGNNHKLKGGFVVVDRHTNGNEYVTGGDGNHLHLTVHRNPDGTGHKRVDDARN